MLRLLVRNSRYVVLQHTFRCIVRDRSLAKMRFTNVNFR